MNSLTLSGNVLAIKDHGPDRSRLFNLECCLSTRTICHRLALIYLFGCAHHQKSDRSDLSDQIDAVRGKKRVRQILSPRHTLLRYVIIPYLGPYVGRLCDER